MNKIKQLALICSVLFFSAMNLFSQSPEYQAKKERKIEEGSPFTKIINRELPATIVYEDADIIAFIPLSQQAKVHFLIVPKKEITSINKVQEKDAKLLGQMILVAAKLAKEYNIDESGYRLSFNTNEDSGQSVFHIHLHLLGGNKLGPMVDRIDK